MCLVLLPQAFPGAMSPLPKGPGSVRPGTSPQALFPEELDQEVRGPYRGLKSWNVFGEIIG